MNSALWVAKTGLDAQQTRLSVISNNLANANTMGFKSDRAVFEDLLYQNVRQVGAQSSESTRLPSGLMIGTGVRTVATEKNHSQGNMIQTEGFLDLAVQGRGFFQVLRPDGTLSYTRDGSFQLNATGEIVTAGGNPLQPAMSPSVQTVLFRLLFPVPSHQRKLVIFNWPISQILQGYNLRVKIYTVKVLPVVLLKRERQV